MQQVRPGPTGWGQVHGLNEIGWEEKFALEVWNVENGSLRTDLGILFGTMAHVLGQRGIAGEWHATTHEFRGRADE
ncbi:MAG: sugar transferase [Myxococcota bacterium]